MLRVIASLCFVATFGCGKEISDQNISDAGTSADASNVADAGIKPFSGQISIKQYSRGGTFSNGSIDATFAETIAKDCTTVVAGACTYSDCSTSGARVGVSVGSISFSGGQLSSTKVLTYNPSLQNYSADLLAPAFQAGDEFEIIATGADVSAFDGRTAKAPADIELTSPFQDDGGTFVLDESQDLVLTWTSGFPGSTTGVLVDSEGPKQIECTFDGAGGTGTIPSSLLRQLGTLTSSDIAGIGVVPQAITTLQTEDATVTVLLQASGSELPFTSP